jgi:hypothetical protein
MHLGGKKAERPAIIGLFSPSKVRRNLCFSAACRLFPVVSDIPSRETSLASEGLGVPVQSLPQVDGDQAPGSYCRLAADNLADNNCRITKGIL